MSEMTSYVQGTPCWVDLATTDVPAAREFYTALFGWDYVEGPPESNNYTQAMLNGKTVAGLFNPDRAEVPVAWTVYLAADDADVIARAVTDNGGQLAMPVMDVMGEGRMLVAIDPSNAVIGAWEPGRHRGAQLVNQPGTVIWNELATTDAAAARRFYAAVFGVEISDPMPGDFDYTTIKTNGRDVGGIWAADEVMSGGTPAHWATYFATVDTDKTADAVTNAGGKVIHEPKDTTYGRMATFLDPQGAAFSVMSAPAEG